ncbi:MAG: tRNA threonylcarbamoyladenosine dehydratase [Candidatus Omnitrophica bacterium]|nr:tRNA threonylcarbamoyladenosine dehydratase [Candidatus Omnitrophota bacterium]MDD5670422.1 tRNA threonylcarbamoyladenosine dehydratase [Candidatus Omnitrophota bacterium]
MERFTRTEQLLGTNALRKLAQARVAVFGLGAVGSFAVEALARAGIGRFVLVDFDRIRHSNFNRQLFALESNLGKAKAELARARILEINPECQVDIHPVFAGPENFAELLNPRPDMVLDAIDSLTPKVGLISYCVSEGLPLIASMGAGAKLDPLAVRLGDISEVKACFFAKRLKSVLKKKGIRAGVRCVYSLEKPMKSRMPAKKEPGEYARGRERVPVGTIAYMPAIFGLVAASDVIRTIAGEI